MVLRVGKSSLSLSKLRERERSNLVYLALVNFSSGLIELNEWNVAIIFHPPCACFLFFAP